MYTERSLSSRVGTREVDVLEHAERRLRASDLGLQSIPAHRRRCERSRRARSRARTARRSFRARTTPRPPRNRSPRGGPSRAAARPTGRERHRARFAVQSTIEYAPRADGQDRLDAIEHRALRLDDQLRHDFRIRRRLQHRRRRERFAQLVGVREVAVMREGEVAEIGPLEQRLGVDDDRRAGRRVARVADRDVAAQLAEDILVEDGPQEPHLLVRADRAAVGGGDARPTPGRGAGARRAQKTRVGLRRGPVRRPPLSRTSSFHYSRQRRLRRGRGRPNRSRAVRRRFAAKQGRC